MLPTVFYLYFLTFITFCNFICLTVKVIKSALLRRDTAVIKIIKCESLIWGLQGFARAQTIELSVLR